MALVTELAKNVNGAGEYDVTVELNLPVTACTICMNAFEGLGVSVGPVDNLCLACGRAIRVAMERYDGFKGIEPTPKRYEDMFEDGIGVPPIEQPASVTILEAKQKSPTKRVAKKAVKK